MALELLTYGDVSRVDDVVLNSIELLTAREDSIMTILGKTEAKDTLHSYLVDSLDTPGSLAVEMGRDLTNVALTTPSRLLNIVQEVAKTFTVARPQEKVQHFHGQNETERQVSKALMDWGNAFEFDLIRSTLTSGVSGAAAKMKGIIQAISKSTNTTAHTSGTVMSASILDGLMQANWENSNNDVATDLYVGGLMRRNIDYFTQKSNIVVNNATGGSTIVKTVSTYETAMGTLSVHKHRYVDISGTDATLRLLAIRPEKLKIAYLDRPTILDLAKNGPYTRKSVYGSGTLEVRNQDSNWFTSGFLRA